MTSFDAVSRQVLAEFLQTAVVIDDQAYGSKSVQEPAPGLQSPSRVQEKADDASENAARTQSAHSLDTPLLVDTFARQGLVCAVIAPQKEEPIAQRLGPVADRCDIVIIDWQIFDDDGERTRALIKDLCERDHGDRLRLLCVYSGEKDLENISDQLTQQIEGLTHHNDDKFLLRKDHVIVTILGKSVVPVDRIAGVLVDRFSIFTKGLLSNTVLAALTGIRRNVHRIVQKFDAKLDPAYISHRIMSVPIDTVESEILSLIGAELESVIHQSKASLYIDSNAIEKWIDSDAAQHIIYAQFPDEKSGKQKTLNKLISFGSDKHIEDASSQFIQLCNKIVKSDTVKESRLTEWLGGEDSKNLDRRFAMLSTIETHYEDYIPQLTLGTIVHDEEQYLLCLMPRCDSARVPIKGRDFLFAKLTACPPTFDLIVEDNEKLVDLDVSMHPYDTVIYCFTPSEDKKPVTARKEKGTWLFDRIPQYGPVRWVAELKPQIAQAFANEYASQVCRVGVSKSQWLHRLKNK